MDVKFLDLKSQYLKIKDDINKAITNVIEKTAFIGGEDLDKFNESFTEYIGAQYGFGVGNGTDALMISLLAMGIGPGDRVIVPANTFIATAETVTATGAEVVFIDCDPDYYTLDVTKLEEVYAKYDNIKAIIPVHLYGQPAMLDEIITFAKKYNLLVLEDCAQAQGTKYKGANVGTFGDMGIFSFYPGKNLGAYGDGGFILTNNQEYYIKAKKYSNHGRIEKYNHEFEGYNSRLDNLQAAVLNVKLPYLASWNAGRRRVAKLYDELLSDCENLVIPKVMTNVEHIYHLYVIRAEKRDELRAFLAENEISTGIHYPIGLPFLKAYEYLKYRAEDFPVAHSYQSKLLSLPIYPELTDTKIEYIVSKIKEFYQA